MQQVTLGRTGLKTNKNAFGALPIQRVSAEYAGMLLRKAYEEGITLFDTARAYSDSETKISLALSDVRDKIIIASKTMTKTAEGFWKDLETSLTMLKTDYIDIYQYHNPEYCPRPGDEAGLYDAMLKAKEQGKIRFIGLSNHRLDVAKQAVESGLYDTLQFPFNYLASEQEIELVKLCAQKNVGFIAMKALSGGLLNQAGAACAWLGQYANVVPIWGIQRESELEELVRYIHNPPELTPEYRAVIERDCAELSGQFCRACGYCMPCPAGIQINQCARMMQLIRRSPSANWLSPSAQEMMMNAENCTECGQCRGKCPYNLNPPELLKRNLADYRSILSGKITV